VQNAVRHVIAEREEGGALSIEARREGAGLVLAVWDDGPAFSLAQSEPGQVSTTSGPAWPPSTAPRGSSRRSRRRLASASSC